LGQYGQDSTGGFVNSFKAFVKPCFKKELYLRIGGQKVKPDKGRLFSAVNRNQEFRAHDRLNYICKKIVLLQN